MSGAMRAPDEERSPGARSLEDYYGRTRPFAEGTSSEEVGPRQRVKHRLAAALREVVERAALLDVERLPEGELERLCEEAEALAARLGEGPSLERFGSPALAPPPQGALFERSPVSGRSNPLAPPLELWQDGEVVRGRAVYGTAYEGPPSFLHGGVAAAAFDELLGVTQALSGQIGLTARLSVTFRRPTPLRAPISYEAVSSKSEGRKTVVGGKAFIDSTLLAEAEALFVVPTDLPGLPATAPKNEPR